MTFVRDGVEVTKLRVHAECLLPEENVRWMKRAAKAQGIPLRALTGCMLQEVINARMEDLRRASLPSEEEQRQERERAASDIEKIEAALQLAAQITPRKGKQKIEAWLEEQLRFARLIADGHATPAPRSKGER